MTSKTLLSEIVLTALSENIDAVLVRGTDAHVRDRGDLDFLVPQKLSVEAAALIADAVRAAGWAVVGFRHLGYVTQLCVIWPQPREQQDVSFKIDISNGLAWYGIGLDSIGNAILERRPDLSEAETISLTTFFQKLLYPGYLRERDRLRVFSGISVERIEEFCSYAGLRMSRADIEAGRLRKADRWRLRAATAGVRGLRLIPWFAKAVFADLKFRTKLGTHGGKVIGISGMDGSGKSTLIERFCAAIEASEFTSPKVVHLLPDAVPTPHRLARRTKTASNYTKPYSEPPVKTRLNGMLRLTYYFVAFAASRIWSKVKVAQGGLLVFDRSIIDFSSDLARARIPHMQLPRWLVRALLPSGTFFYIDAEPETVVARKGELTLERAKGLSRNYRLTVVLGGVIRLDGERDIDTVFTEFLSLVTDKTISDIAKLRPKVDR